MSFNYSINKFILWWNGINLRKESFMENFKRKQKEQIESRSMDDFMPVDERIIEKMNKSPHSAYRSEIFYSMMPTYSKRWAKIIYLKWSARAMTIASCEGGQYQYPSPSNLFNDISEYFFELSNAAVAGTPTDLLVLIDAESGGFVNRDLRSGKTRLQIINEAIDEEEKFYLHSLHCLKYRLLRIHFEGLDEAGFLAFRRAILTLDSIGLFYDGEVSPLAIDCFPCLAEREKELVERRAALKWRPETPEDPVVKVPVQADR